MEKTHVRGVLLVQKYMQIHDVPVAVVISFHCVSHDLLSFVRFPFNVRLRTKFVKQITKVLCSLTKTKRGSN